MARVKLNTHLREHIVKGPRGPIQIRFNEELQLMMAEHNPAIANMEYTSWYVRNPSIEERIQSYFNQSIDNIQFFVGWIGIGKSTTLRYLLNINDNPAVNDSKIIVPFFFNNKSLTDSSFSRRFQQQLLSASEIIRQSFGLEESTGGLAPFIKSHRLDLLQDVNLDDGADDATRIANFKEKDKTAYAMEFFKWRVDQSGLKRVVIVVDDIESETIEIQTKLVHDICRLNFCLKNLAKRNYKVITLISCRPSTRQILLKQPQLSPYTLHKAPLEFTDPVDIGTIFEARFETAVNRKTFASPDRRAAWENARDIAKTVASSLWNSRGIADLDFDDGIPRDSNGRVHSRRSVLQQLFNDNIRETLVEFVNILANRRYIAAENINIADLDVTLKNFKIDRASVLRALAYGEGRVYSPSNSRLPNPLFNTEDPNTDLLAAFFLRGLMAQSEAEQTGSRSVNLQDYRKAFSHIFSYERIENYIDAICEQSVQRGFVTVEKMEREGRQEDWIEVMPSTFAVFRLLSSRSFILEALRDDTFYDVGEDYVKPLLALPEEIAFCGLIEFAEALARAEIMHFRNAERLSRERDYIRLFGPISISDGLRRGLERSLQAVFSGDFKHTKAGKSFARYSEQVDAFNQILMSRVN